ncbi:MAG: HD-GYP domain-containing protein [Phycisphaerales bacterium]
MPLIRALLVATPERLTLDYRFHLLRPAGPGIDAILHALLHDRIDLVIGPETIQGRPLREIVLAAPTPPPVLVLCPPGTPPLRGGLGSDLDPLFSGPCPGMAERAFDYGLVGRRLRTPYARSVPRVDPETGLRAADRIAASLRAGLGGSLPTACIIADAGLDAVARSIHARGLRGFRWDDRRVAIFLHECTSEHAILFAESWRTELSASSPDSMHTNAALGVAHAPHGPSLDLIRRAALALDHAQHANLGIDWWDALAARHLAACTHANGTLAERATEFLRRLAPRLGPTQRDHLTSHARDVEQTAEGLARLMRLPPVDIEAIRLAARLHDLGKVAIPEPILARPGPLTPAERRIVDRHADEGATLARLLGAPTPVCELIRHHHHRYDGGPAPIGGLVIAVADALATMTADRTYSRARTLSEALAELRKGRGTRFHPGAVVAAHLLAPGLMRAAA